MNKENNKLGMGLGALLNTKNQNKNNTNKIDISKIYPNKEQPRKNFEEKDVRDPDNATFGSFLAVFASFWPIERQIWISKGCPLDNYCYSAQKEAIRAISLKKSQTHIFLYRAWPLGPYKCRFCQV